MHARLAVCRVALYEDHRMAHKCPFSFSEATTVVAHPLRLGTLAALLGMCFLPAARADKPALGGIIKRGKAATVLVDVQATGASGTGFCVHPSGLFVTSDQIIRSIGDKVSLVLAPGLKAESKHDARVLRLDRELGLALLCVETKSDLPALVSRAHQRAPRTRRKCPLENTSAPSLRERSRAITRSARAPTCATLSP